MSVLAYKMTWPAPPSPHPISPPMYQSESVFFESDAESASLASYYNQLNRFPFLPLSSSLSMSPPSSGGFSGHGLTLDGFERNFAAAPSMRRMSSSSSCSSVSSDFCLPTSSVFMSHPHFQDIEFSPSPSPIDVDAAQFETSAHPTPVQSPASTQPGPFSSQTASVAKKPRAPPREKISTKDFKPPDVSGLSKREARLVKNRAAAFLSRQRKREEFESMEVRVAELEKENARLLNQLNTGGQEAMSDGTLHAEVSTMRSQLAASEQRAASLREELNQLRASSSPVSPTFPPFRGPSSVKKEPFDMTFDRSPSPSSSDSSGAAMWTDKEKTGARLGLMILLSLSSLFSKSALGPSPSKFTISADSLPPASASDHALFNSILRPEWEFGAQNVARDDDKARAQPRDAEFEVSFVTSPDDGKVRVRLSLPQHAGAESFGSSSFPWEQPAVMPELFSFDLPRSDEFLLDDAFSPHSTHLDSPGAFLNTKKRLRISLKNTTGSSGAGEWDVEVC